MQDWGLQLLLRGDLGTVLLWLWGNSGRHCQGCRPLVRCICVANAGAAECSQAEVNAMQQRPGKLQV